MTTVISPWSFDPYTRWHNDLLKRTAQKFDKVIVWVGQNSNKNYMFSFPERVEMIKCAIKEGTDEVLNIEVLPYSWLLVDFAFEQWVSTIVRGIRWSADLEAESMLHQVWDSQQLWIDTVFMLSKQDQTHVSSSTTKAILKEQWLIQDYVTLNVKHFMEARMMWQYIVWLTGSIWAWKSYITDRFLELWEENNIEVHNIDLDKIGHWILWEATEKWYVNIRNTLAEIFWEKIKKSDWFIDRKILWEIVFNNPEKRKELDKILFNSIILRIRKEISWKKWIILLNWALLVEAWITDLTNNNVVLVWVDSDIQKERLSGRWHSDEEIDRRINSQFTSANKKEKLEENIDSSWYGKISEIKNNWNNSYYIEKTFNDMLCNVDIYWELRIKSVMTKLWLEDKWLDLYAKVKPLHDDSSRMYHNWFHIVSWLNHLYEVKEELSEEEFIELFFAFIFHDSIYNPRIKWWKNERDSAEIAWEILTELWIKKELIEKIKWLILLTISHNIDDKNNIWKYMIDIDLSILWQEWDTYFEHTKSINYEYSSYSDEEYKKWRLKFVEWFIKKQIFQTEYFYNKYEEQAKENLQKEIIILKSELWIK